MKKQCNLGGAALDYSQVQQRVTSVKLMKGLKDEMPQTLQQTLQDQGMVELTESFWH